MNHFMPFETLSLKYTVKVIYRIAVVNIYDPFSVLAYCCNGTFSHSLFRDSSSASKVNKLIIMYFHSSGFYLCYG